MCFSESQSYINAALLSSAGLYVLPEYKLSLVGIFFALKELLQGLLYKYLDNEIMLKYLSMTSWVHICFQSLIINILYSYFDPKNIVWKITFIIAFIYISSYSLVLFKWTMYYNLYNTKNGWSQKCPNIITIF